MDALDKMLSTYPDGSGSGNDEEEREQHRDLLKLEKAGKVARHCDMEHSDQVPVRYVIWVPVEEAAPAPAPEPEPVPEPAPEPEPNP